MNQKKARRNSEDELVVSQILLGLRKRVSLSESLADSNWGRRRKRSCPGEDPPLPRESEKKSTPEKGVDAASPTTPLSFSPIESDHSFSKASKKQAREIEVLLRNRDVLRGGIEGAKKHYEKLKAYNSELRTIKLKLEQGGKIGYQGLCPKTGPLLIDLNLPAGVALGEPSDAMEDKRFRFAEARRKRRELMRAKSMRFS